MYKMIINGYVIIKIKFFNIINPMAKADNNHITIPCIIIMKTEHISKADSGNIYFFTCKRYAGVVMRTDNKRRPINLSNQVGLKPRYKGTLFIMKIMDLFLQWGQFFFLSTFTSVSVSLISRAAIGFIKSSYAFILSLSF